MITFKPLAGDSSDDNTKPLAYLLQIDDISILLDCGSPDWCPESNADSPPYPWSTYCSTLQELSPNIDLVLFSHGDLSHTGLYAYAYSRWGLRAPAYATLPVQALARISILEDIEGIRSQESVDQPSDPEESINVESEASSSKILGKCVATPKEVQEAMDSINTLRYSQPTHLQGKCQGLAITAFNAGHTLGGTVWKIRSPTSGTILYAVNLNHTKERHLDGTILLKSGGASGVFEPLARPDLLITDAERTNAIGSRRKDKDAQLIDTITSTLSSRHSILMPCDAGPRLLELLVLLDQHWSFARLKYPMCLVSKTGKEMLTFIRSMMEWLGGTLSKEDMGEEGRGKHDGKRKRDDDNEDEALGALSLRFKHLEFFASPQALLHTYSSKDPKLILAVPLSLSHGPSRTIFSEFANVAYNVVLLTSRGESGTLSELLFNRWNEMQRPEDRWDKGRTGAGVMLDGTISLRIHSKIPLQGAELEEYLQKERAAQEREAAQQAAQVRSQQMLEADEDESDSESDQSDDEMAVEDALESEDGTSFAEPGVKSARAKRKGHNQTEVNDWKIETEDGPTKQLLSYDIYLKGNVSKTTSFFKSASGQTQRFRMFPFVEKRRRVDEYGEVLDVGTWLRKGKIFDQEAEDETAKDNKKRQTMLEESKKTPSEPPSKFISSMIDVQLACRLLFIDVEGLNDGRAVKSIVPQINPRKMIIVHASQDASEALRSACASIRTMTKEIYTTKIGSVVQIGQQTNSFSISLGEDLLKSLKMSRFEDNEIGLVVGRISSLAGSTIPVLEPVSTTHADTTTQKVTVSLPRRLGSRPPTKLTQSTLIGDLKLTALKSRLAASGIEGEFVGGGVLLCGGKKKGTDDTVPLVIVRKSGVGRVELEGPVSELYYTVRKEVYNLYAYISS